MIAKAMSCALSGLDGHIIEIEADAGTGLPSFDIVGLPDMAVKEARDRVRSAIKNCNFEFPSRRYTVNLAPARIKKEGSAFDLPIAVAILAATGQLSAGAGGHLLLGELSLSGELRPITGALPLVLGGAGAGFKSVILPAANAREAAIAKGISVFGAKTLFDVVAHLRGEAPITATGCEADSVFSAAPQKGIDFADVKGQENVKRALEIAAAGGHNCLIVGAPGSGKSMLAQRLPTILPGLTFEEALEVTKIHSIAGLLNDERPFTAARPFRSPHHSISTAGLVGGGTNPKPGELSLAHNGVLFLDELPEFKKDAMEVMRQPLEDGVVTISRVSASVTYPCQVTLVAAMNPCHCGYYGDSARRCRCSESAVAKYLQRVSGPLLDRMDIQVEASSVKYRDLHAPRGETSENIRKRVSAARKIQQERYAGETFFSNARLYGSKIEEFCRLTAGAAALMRSAFTHMKMSARAYTRVLKVARTIADLEGGDIITDMHIAEAVQYRCLDKKFWG